MEPSSAALVLVTRPAPLAATPRGRGNALISPADAFLGASRPAGPGCCESEARKQRLRLHDALEREVKRMAHSLHDEAGQLIALVCLQLDELSGKLPAARQGCVEELKTMLVDFEGELRRLSHELRPMILDDFGLLPALEFLRQGFAKRTGIAISLKGATRGRVATAVETSLYRIVHEMLRIAQMSQAATIAISITCEENRIECSIRQEGGVAVNQESAILAIGRRVEDLSGAILTCTSPDGAVETTMAIPLDAEWESAAAQGVTKPRLTA